MRIAYYKYHHSNRNYINGANLYYSEISRLLEGQKISLVPHNDLKDLSKLKELSGNDILLSNIGPYAFFYFYLREKLKGKFSIIRDVQTALWDGYLFQEDTCTDFMRERDKVLFLSEFARQLYISLFPDKLNEHNTFVCAPFMHFFPKPAEETNKETSTLGWIGRVSKDKNFGAALNTFIKVHKELKNVDMLVAGPVLDGIYEPSIVKKELAKLGINPNNYRHINNGNFIPYNQIWNILQQIDMFLFPSASSVETLGRTLIEASHLNKLVIASNHAATPELFPDENLVKVDYTKDTFNLTFLHSLGDVDIDEMVEKCIRHKDIPKNSYVDKYKDHDKKFLEILLNDNHDKIMELRSNIQKFIKNVRIFLNPDYKLKKYDAMKKASIELLKEDFGNIGATSHNILMKLNYKPYARIPSG